MRRNRPANLRVLQQRIDDWTSRRAEPRRTVAQLARVAGVRAETISRWCNGVSNPDIGGDSWRRFCAALEMTPAQSRELNVLFGAPLTETNQQEPT